MYLIKLLLPLVLFLFTSFHSQAIEVLSCDTEECKNQFKKYKKFAKNGSPDAQEILANLYLNGYGTDVKPSLAAKWFKKAANQGQYGAKASLAFMHIRGQGKKQNVEQGIKILQRLSSKNVSQASLQLGVLYAQGQYVKQDYQVAEQWFSTAISQGNQKAIMILALMYEHGLTGENKIEDAKLLYQHLAPSNEDAAQRLKILSEQQPKASGQRSIDIFNLNNRDEDIEHIEVVNNIDSFLTDNLNFIKSQGIYTSSSTGSRIKGKRCTDNVNCKAAINAQDKFNIMDFWQGFNTVRPHINTGGLR